MSKLSASSIAAVEAATDWRKNRVQVFDFPEGKVIVKGQRPKRGPWRYRLLALVGRLVRVAAVKPVPVPGGANSQALELGRLKAMAENAILVPEVMHVAPDYFVMRYLGNSDLAVQLREKGFGAFELWKQAALLIIQVHDAGQYVSQCFARNIVVGQQESEHYIAGLIDFEDDPAVVMSPLEAQVRDWLTFLQSSIYSLAAPPHILQSALTQLLDREREEIRQALFAECIRLAWLRHLPASRKPWGKDVANTQAAMQSMHMHLIQRQLINKR
jgi:Lipopolysaccharide kinase (Kdo/WaaP) family